MDHIVISVKSEQFEAADDGAMYPSLDAAAQKALRGALQMLAEDIDNGMATPVVEVELLAPEGQPLQRLRLIVKVEPFE